MTADFGGRVSESEARRVLEALGAELGPLISDFRITMTTARAAVNATSRRGNPSKATPRDRPARNWA